MALMTKTDEEPPKGRRAPQREAARTGDGKDGGAGSDRGQGGDKAAESFVPTLPRVNLLPRAVTEHVRLVKLRRIFGLGAVAAVAAIAAAYTLQSGAISTANDGLAVEQTRASQLSSQVATLTPVKVYYAAVEANATTIRETMAREVLLSDIVTRLYASAPPNVDLGTVAITVSSQAVPPASATPDPAAPAASACPSPDPYVVPDAAAGCVTITGSATTRAALGNWETRISGSKLFSNLFISSSQAAADVDQQAITFSATLAVTKAAYVNRYADPAFLEETTP
jgi:Tfp pilus assembly protein PilN